MGKKVVNLKEHSKTEAEEKIEMQGSGFFGFSGEHLKQIVARIERLEEERVNICDDIKEVYGEAKGVGFDVKIIKMILKEKKLDKDAQLEQEHLLTVYRAALGMLPLEEYAAQRDAQNTKVTINGKECDLEHFINAAKINATIIEHVKLMHQMGGFRPHSDADTKVAQKFIEFGLLKQPNKFDDLYLLTAKAEKLATK